MSLSGVKKLLIRNKDEIVLVLEDKKFTELSPVTAGMEKCTPDKSFGPCIRDFYLIHFIEKGSGTFVSPKGEYRVSEGNAFLIRPGEICTYTTDKENPWTYLWIGFDGKLAKDFEMHETVFGYDQAVTDEIKNVFDLSGGAEEYLAGVLFKLYAEIFGEKEKQDYASRVKGYINANYMKNISISEISDIMNVNRKYLARIFKEKAGVSMKQFLIDKRLKEAKRLLEKGYGVEETGIMTGYADGFTFSKAFKKKYGVSPVFFKKIK